MFATLRLRLCCDTSRMIVTAAPNKNKNLCWPYYLKRMCRNQFPHLFVLGRPRCDPQLAVSYGNRWCPSCPTKAVWLPFCFLPYPVKFPEDRVKAKGYCCQNVSTQRIEQNAVPPEKVSKTKGGTPQMIPYPRHPGSQIEAISIHVTIVKAAELYLWMLWESQTGPSSGWYTGFLCRMSAQFWDKFLRILKVQKCMCGAGWYMPLWCCIALTSCGFRSHKILQIYTVYIYILWIIYSYLFTKY